MILAVVWTPSRDSCKVRSFNACGCYVPLELVISIAEAIAPEPPVRWRTPTTPETRGSNDMSEFEISRVLRGIRNDLTFLVECGALPSETYKEIDAKLPAKVSTVKATPSATAQRASTKSPPQLLKQENAVGSLAAQFATMPSKTNTSVSKQSVPQQPKMPAQIASTVPAVVKTALPPQPPAYLGLGVAEVLYDYKAVDEGDLELRKV